MCQRLATFKLFRRSTEVYTRKNTALTMLQMKGSLLIMSRASFLFLLYTVSCKLLQTSVPTRELVSRARLYRSYVATLADQITVQNGYINSEYKLTWLEIAIISRCISGLTRTATSSPLPYERFSTVQRTCAIIV